MSKRLVHELTYDATPDQVAAMLQDPAFREEVCVAQGAVRHDVTVAGGTVNIDQVRPAQGLPSFATRIVGDEINIVQRESWGTATAGDIDVAIPGKPGSMTGTATLQERDGGTVETVEMTVTVKIPVVGGKLEGLIADILVKALKTENRVGRDYLAR